MGFAAMKRDCDRISQPRIVTATGFAATNRDCNGFRSHKSQLRWILQPRIKTAMGFAATESQLRWVSHRGNGSIAIGDCRTLVYNNWSALAAPDPPIESSFQSLTRTEARD